MSKRWQRWAICASIAVGSAVGVRLLSNLRFFELLNLKALDAHFILRGTLRPETPPESKITLILADQKTLDTFPELRLFWHPYYAAAIRAAGEGGAKVIGLDVVFGVPVERWEQGLDGLIAEAVTTSPVPVVSGNVVDLNGNPKAQNVPVNMLSAALGLWGFSNLTADPDDFVRRQELIEAEPPNSSDAPPARSFALRVVEKYLGTDAGFHNGELTLDGNRIPIEPPGTANPRSILIRDANPPGSVEAVSLADVFAAEQKGDKQILKGWFSGKIVLIGSDTVDDRYATPFYTLLAGPRWRTTAGVEIHADTIRTLLGRKYLLDVPGWIREAALLTAAGVASGIVTGLAAGPAAAWIGAEILGILAITHLLFLGGLVLSTSETAVAALASAVLTMVYRVLTAERRGNLFHRAFSLFVGKGVAQSLEESAAIQLSARRLNVTIMFTDIRGFTAFTEKMCEEQGPEVVVELLNQYLAQMVAIMVKHHGQVNKFIGDGILGIFSDEDEGAAPGDHPLRAVQCAIEIVTAPSQFETGTGLHTGLAVVGNVGSADKMEYTVLGDTVNLASRLESLNKENHTRLLMSEATQRALGNAIETRFLGAEPVRGKAVPINLYTVASVAPSSAGAASNPPKTESTPKALTNA
jgi:adenylate cyclase